MWVDNQHILHEQSVLHSGCYLLSLAGLCLCVFDLMLSMCKMTYVRPNSLLHAPGLLLSFLQNLAHMLLAYIHLRTCHVLHELSLLHSECCILFGTV